jgi:hypothetical protein
VVQIATVFEMLHAGSDHISEVSGPLFASPLANSFPFITLWPDSHIASTLMFCRFQNELKVSCKLTTD